MEEIVLVLTTLPEDFDADSLARDLVEGRMAACVSVLPPQTSTYRWNAAIETARECQVVIKTTSSRVGELSTTLRARHPYEVPELLILKVSGGDPTYLDGVRATSRL
jgi:periplasmic divalent cation tolerance protein